MDDRDVRVERRHGVDRLVGVWRAISRISGFAFGRSVSKYERRGMNGRFAAPAVYRATMPKWLYSSSSSAVPAGRDGRGSMRRRIALSPPTPGLPSHEKTSFRATPPAIIWS